MSSFLDNEARGDWGGLKGAEYHLLYAGKKVLDVALTLVTVALLAVGLAYAAPPKATAHDTDAAAHLTFDESFVGPSLLDPLFTKLALAPAASRPAVVGTQYQFTIIDVPGSPLSEAFGINDVNLISGCYYDERFQVHGVLWRNGVPTFLLDPPGSMSTCLGGSNNRGQVSGNFGPTDFVQHATIFDSATSTWIQLPDVPGKPLNYGNAINNVGQVAGAASVAYNVGCVGQGLFQIEIIWRL